MAQARSEVTDTGSIPDPQEATAEQDKPHSFIHTEWVYEYFHVGDRNIRELIRYEFNGVDVINGKEYNRLEIKDFDIWRFETDTDLVPDNMCDTNKVYYLREENGKIFRYMGYEVETPMETPDELTPPETEGEYLMFDLNLGEGDSYWTFYTAEDEPFEWVKVCIDEKSTIEIDSTDVTMQVIKSVNSYYCGEESYISYSKYENLWIIDGIGPIGSKTIEFYGSIIGLEFNPFVCFYSPRELNNIYDKEGNVVFAGAGITPLQTGVGEIKSSAGITKCRDNLVINPEAAGNLCITDLWGRVVLSQPVESATVSLAPLPKGIYTAVLRLDSGECHRLPFIK